MTGSTGPRRLLVLGGGGREHALAWKLAAEPGVEEVLVAPGSAAIARVAGVRRLPFLDALDGAAVVDAARAAAADLVVIGPEAPLAAGVADALAAAGIPVFGPSRAAARIETSKAFCHEIAAAAGVPMARSRAFGAFEPAREHAALLAEAGAGLVVKADGLAAGKGVTVCSTFAEAEAALQSLFATRVPADEPGAVRVVIEERLVGREASVIAIVDGRDAVALPPARDHKRLLDGDRGPNTGGMGACCPIPDLPDEVVRLILATIHRPILAELAARGTPFLGALYAGLMLTDAGPVLIECNARFGDPETQVMLPRLAGPLGPLLMAAALGNLGDLDSTEADDGLIPTLPGAAVGIVLAAAGYPDQPRGGDRIDGLEAALADGALVFHAGTDHDPGIGGYRTHGGRILTVVGQGTDLADARVQAEAAAARIGFDGLQRRRDIAADSIALAALAASTGASR